MLSECYGLPSVFGRTNKYWLVHSGLIGIWILALQSENHVLLSEIQVGTCISDLIASLEQEILSN